MKQENRHQAILYAVMRQGYVSIESLAEELGVSSQTIRRDISELDRTGMLERRPGGASCRTTILNSTYDARQVEDFKDKERIARTIAEYIPDNSSIFLTLGTTVEVIAYALLERSGLMVITNNVVAALTLNKKTDFEVVLASGYMRKSSNGLVGESTIEFVNGFQCDYVIDRSPLPGHALACRNGYRRLPHGRPGRHFDAAFRCPFPHFQAHGRSYGRRRKIRTAPQGPP